MIEWLLYNPANLCTFFEHKPLSELAAVLNSNPVLCSSEEDAVDYELTEDFLIRT